MSQSRLALSSQDYCYPLAPTMPDCSTSSTSACRDELPEPSLTMLEAGDATSLQPHPVSTDHKYSQGVVGVAAGSAAYPGAAVLAVGAALLTKPGLVRYSGTATREVIEAWPSAIVSANRPTWLDVLRLGRWDRG